MKIALVILLIITIVYLTKRVFDINTYNQNKEKIIDTIENFYNELNCDKYICHSDCLIIKKKYIEESDFFRTIILPHKEEIRAKIVSFFKDLNDIEYLVKNHNDSYIEYEKNRYDKLFSNIDGKSLDDQQRTAVITDEDHNLVVAGAGSGKTLTIAGKVKYLCETKGIKPDEILLISFTRKSAQEMTERIANRLGYSVHATTFHKLGLDILRDATNTNYDVLDDMRPFFEEYFSKGINENKELLMNLIEYFAYYLQIPSDMNKYDSLGEMYEHEKSADLETIKSKYTTASFTEEEKEKRLKEKKTLKDEQVKSLEEIQIANFLFLHGIEYEYEKLFPYQDVENNRKTYHPDFYLKDYDIYIEHFGVNENLRCPQLSPIEEEKYIEDMNWKISWHSKNKTKLLKTYSYYQSQGILLEKLDELLKNNNVEYKEVNLENIFDVVYAKQGKKYFTEFISLCCTFISLFKSNGYVLEDLKKLQYKDKDLTESPYFSRRLIVFKEIMSVLLSEYDKHLREHNAYDFSDMINISTKKIVEGQQVNKYKYVIIDEFQDISVSRYKLVKAILDQTNAKLLCVGDDWQSIYRFAGSDISLFTNFIEYFGYSEIMRIEKTYRNSQELIDAAGRFVMENPKQIRKNLKSERRISNPIKICYYNDNINEVLKGILDEIVNSCGKDSSILLLGRTSYDFEVVKNSGLFYGNKISELHYIKSPENPISFLTVHKSKGLEADNVIILNFENSTLGFPNKIADDPLLQTVLSESDSFKYAEERRLFYVAITRTKNRTYILTNVSNPSEFKEDIETSMNVEDNPENIKSTDSLCPRCKTGHLVKRINLQTKQAFIGCSNYPKCDYTNNSVKAVEEGKRCPMCGGFLKVTTGKFGAFYGCTNYPKCTYTEEYPYYLVCPNCGSDMILRKGKNGAFWGCSNYPACKHTEKFS